ncbi:MAG: sugar phosphate isomerase/epimerase [Opitutaceae bacterium]|jgi:L-ribulose-5-phosphate 3-epimerase|nr:sugar phosphate isomerase/epimerase [Opitutaceae bacterium]
MFESLTTRSHGSRLFSTIILCVTVAMANPTSLMAGEGFRVGTCDWTIRMAGQLEAFGFAKKSGLQGIQFSFAEAGQNIDLRERADRDKFRAAIKRTGVACSSLGIAVLNKIPLSNTDAGEQLVVDCIIAMAKLKAEAAELDDPKLAAMVAPNIVLLGFFGKGNINGEPELMESVITKLKRLAPMAESHGMVLGLETLLSEADHRHILDSVNSPALKVYYDTANSARMGYDIYAELESLGAENICQLHLKENGDLLGGGPIDFPRVKRILQEMNYDGWLITEGSIPKGMDRLEASALSAAYALELFGR